MNRPPTRRKAQASNTKSAGGFLRRLINRQDWEAQPALPGGFSESCFIGDGEKHEEIFNRWADSGRIAGSRCGVDGRRLALLAGSRAGHWHIDRLNAGANARPD